MTETPTDRPNAMTTRRNLFYAEVGRTRADSFRIVIRARNSKDPASNPRQLAVCIYDLAAEMERQLDKLGVRWVVSPEAFDAKVILELSDTDDPKAAARFVTTVLTDMGLT